MKRVQVLKNNVPKLYDVLLVQCTPGLHNEVQEDPEYDTNSDSFDCLWLMEKLKLNSSRIAHASNTFHTDLHTLKEVSNLNQGQTESMDYANVVHTYRHTNITTVT